MVEEEKKFSIGLSSVRVKSETKKQKLTEHKADIPEMNSEKELTSDQLELEDSNFKGNFFIISYTNFHSKQCISYSKSCQETDP